MTYKQRFYKNSLFFVRNKIVKGKNDEKSVFLPMNAFMGTDVPNNRLFAHLIVLLSFAESTPFGKAQINLAFRSLNRTFGLRRKYSRSEKLK